MCVNDLLCTGAEPLFFLDYIAMGKDDPARLEKVVQGISDGCVDSDMSLLGGETAIMPDMYANDDYDLAGFAVGVVEKSRLIDGKQIADGDVVIGLPSSGLHSNGYSLVRKIIADAKLDWEDRPDALGGETLAEACLRPTTIYVSAVRKIQTHYQVKQVIHGLAHITGGGLEENLDRIMPKHLNAEIDPTTWTVPTIFSMLQELGSVQTAEMRRVFNMGIGMTMVVSEFYSNAICTRLNDAGIAASPIGKIVPGEGKVSYV